LDVRLHGLDPQCGRLLEGRGVDVEPDDGVPVEEVPSQCTRATPEVEDPLAAADRGHEQGDALRNEDEVALATSFTVMFLVALAKRAHVEPTAALRPSEAIVLRSPSSSEISGSQPRIWRARVMSGWRTCGSSTGSAS